jgi:hypothetical protein
VLVVVASAVFLTFNQNDSNPSYAPFSTGETGTSLFFDTLRLMGYPVRISYTPLTRSSDTEHVYIIIQPYNPHVTAETAEEMLEWVRLGGRLIFLHNTEPTVLDRLFDDAVRREINGFNHYSAGAGAVITGRAHGLTNRRLMQDASPGYELHRFLTLWDAERIYFAAYYHGMHPPDTLFSRLPLIVRLTVIQSGIAVLFLLWHLGKRFGKPVPVYEETEREENEQVRAMARLYMKTHRKDNEKC